MKSLPKSNLRVLIVFALFAILIAYVLYTNERFSGPQPISGDSAGPVGVLTELTELKQRLSGLEARIDAHLSPSKVTSSDRYERIVLTDKRPLTHQTPLTPNAQLWLYDRSLVGTAFPSGPFYSQTKQDEMLYSGFFRNRRGGTFVELGAVDGVTFSNTKFFQDSLGWNGLLIEPSTDYAFLVAGKAKYGSTRPANSFTGKRCSVEQNVNCVNAAVCKEVGTLEMLDSPEGVDGNMVSGAVNMLSEAHKNKYHLNKASVTHKVPCKPFGQILHENDIKRIDLLSLDVEGSEETVLETMDWSIPVHVIVIEANIRTSPTGQEGHERKHRILLQAGFQLLMVYEIDEWWVNPNNAAV